MAQHIHSPAAQKQRLFGAARFEGPANTNGRVAGVHLKQVRSSKGSTCTPVLLVRWAVMYVLSRRAGGSNPTLHARTAHMVLSLTCNATSTSA